MRRSCTVEDKQLELFEDRINRAVNFIETLKAKEKSLLDEKEDIEQKVSDLEEQVALKDRKIDELLETQVYLKNKIETVLNKLESLANFDADNTDDDEKPGADEATSYGYGQSENPETKTEENTSEHGAESTGEIYVEENIVDLKEDTSSEQDDDQGDTTILSPQVDQNPLFDTDEQEEAAEEEEEVSEDHDFNKNTEQDRRPFGDNPFIEM
jgi:hypothetical protein